MSVSEYADSEFEVQYTSSRHNLEIFNLQNCKIAIISNNYRTIVYLRLIK